MTVGWNRPPTAAFADLAAVLPVAVAALTGEIAKMPLTGFPNFRFRKTAAGDLIAAAKDRL